MALPASRFFSASKGKVKQSIQSMSGKTNDMTWEQLCAIESRRRKVLKLHDNNFLLLLLHWDGTVLRLLAKDVLLWITMIVYVGVRVQLRIDLPEFVRHVSNSNISVVGGFLSFFLVFFVVESNKRFVDQYNKSMAMKGRICDVACLTKATLPKHMAHRIVRYMNAAHVSGYVGISDSYSAINFFEPLNKSNNFLTNEELVRIYEIDMDSGGAVHLELVTWVLMDIQKALKDGLIDNIQTNQLREIVIELRRSFSDLTNFADQPISFFYVHFIVLLSSLYLPLFAVSAAYNAGSDKVYWSADLIGGLIVWLQAIFVIGLRIIGLVMQDPFGSDVEDLSVIHYVNFTWKSSNRILEAKNPEPLDSRVEDKITLTRAPLGAAWDPISKTEAAENIAVLTEQAEVAPACSNEDDEEQGPLHADGIEIIINPTTSNDAKF